jgi:hypothetical protein
VGQPSLFIKKREMGTVYLLQEKKVTEEGSRVSISVEWLVEPTDLSLIPELSV